ncbi:MAG: hypothetical protein JWM80_5190 [Cyanobacteria bacterium RYN_339]|nr:hypothetical protein [Cyanobacteria bacterium RYN_339]
MPECPVCKKGPGTYYKCYSAALAKLLEKYPAIADGAENWETMEPEVPITNESKFEEVYNRSGETNYRRGKTKVPFLAVHLNGDRPDQVVFDYPLVPFNTFEAFSKVQREQDRFLVFLCPACAQAAHRDLELEPFELWQLVAYPCPCCGYYTMKTSAPYEVCPVCYWTEPDPGYERHLAEAQENFVRFGARDEGWRNYVRRPRLEEHPRFYRYFA